MRKRTVFHHDYDLPPTSNELEEMSNTVGMELVSVVQYTKYPINTNDLPYPRDVWRAYFTGVIGT